MIFTHRILGYYFRPPQVGRGNVLTAVCLSMSLFVIRITQKVIGGFSRNMRNNR